MIISAFQATFDSMNKGLIRYYHKHRSLRVMSALVSPWFMPADFMYNYSLRSV